jgi:hypothetical protein
VTAANHDAVAAVETLAKNPRRLQSILAASS